MQQLRDDNTFLKDQIKFYTSAYAKAGEHLFDAQAQIEELRTQISQQK